MSKYRLLATAFAFGLAAAPALAEDIPGTDFASGNWAGRAWGENGAFVDCYVSANFSNGEVMTVSFTADDTLTVYLSAPEMKFDPSKSYDATMMTEVGFPITGQAFAPNADYIGFSLAGVDPAIDYLTQGAYLRLLGVGIDQSFDVRGLGGALAQGRACLMAQKGGAATAAAEPAAPEKPVLGIKGKGAKPVQMSLDIGTFKRQHMPCKDDACK
jgi:hypothetical protein